MEALSIIKTFPAIQFELFWGEIQSKQEFPQTTNHKIFETDSNFYVKQCNPGKFLFLYFKSLLLVLRKVSFWQGYWALNYLGTFMIFLNFLRS